MMLCLDLAQQAPTTFSMRRIEVSGGVARDFTPDEASLSIRTIPRRR